MVTAVTGKRLSAVGKLTDRSDSGLRVELDPLQESGSLHLGEIFSVESGDLVIVSELLAYRSEQRGFCLLFNVLHTADAKELESLERQYAIDAVVDWAPQPVHVPASLPVSGVAEPVAVGAPIQPVLRKRWSLFGQKQHSETSRGHGEAASYLLSLIPGSTLTEPSDMTIFSRTTSLPGCASP